MFKRLTSHTANCMWRCTSCYTKMLPAARRLAMATTDTTGPGWQIESKHQAWNWLYFGNWINPCKYTFPREMPEMCGWINWINPCKWTFPKKMPEMCGWRTAFPTSHVIRYVIVFLCNFTQLQAALQWGYCFQFASWDLGYQRLPSPAAVLQVTLMWKAL